jgi:colicin import membrane protein
MAANVYMPHSTMGSRKEYALPFSVSFAAHILLIALFVFSPLAGDSSRRLTLPPVISVTMVTLPTASEPLPTPVAAKPAAVRKQTRPAKPADISLAPKQPDRPADTPKVIKSLKKKTFKPSKVVESALTRIEQSVEEEQANAVQAAIERLRSKMPDQAGPDTPRAKASKQVGIPGKVKIDSKEIVEIIDIYRVEIAFQIQKNWAFSQSLAGGAKDLTAEIVFRVMPDGEIRDIWFDKRSGNAYLDESARRAIMKSNPVSPHPEGLSKPFIPVGLRFTPEGVR